VERREKRGSAEELGGTEIHGEKKGSGREKGLRGGAWRYGVTRRKKRVLGEVWRGRYRHRTNKNSA
jgi:hypothetical protein